MSLSIPLGKVGYGNQIFIIGAAISLSKRGIKIKVISYLDKSDSVTSLFSESISNFSIQMFHKYSTYGLYKFLLKRFPSAEDLVKRLFKFKESTGYDEINFLINSKKAQILDSYFQDFRWLISFEQEYKDRFNSIEKSKQLLDLENRFTGRTLGIHVRRGDYKLHYQTFGVLSKRYYDYAVSTLNLTEYDQIAIFSDEPEWCDQFTYGELKSLIIGVENLSSVGETHYLMGKCEALICANSTYSLSAAYLWNISKVIAPKELYFDSSIAENLTSSYPPEWKAIDSFWEASPSNN